jgi:hypothetical protein
LATPASAVANVTAETIQMRLTGHPRQGIPAIPRPSHPRPHWLSASRTPRPAWHRSPPKPESGRLAERARPPPPPFDPPRHRVLAFSVTTARWTAPSRCGCHDLGRTRAASNRNAASPDRRKSRRNAGKNGQAGRGTETLKPCCGPARSCSGPRRRWHDTRRPAPPRPPLRPRALVVALLRAVLRHATRSRGARGASTPPAPQRAPPRRSWANRRSHAYTGQSWNHRLRWSRGAQSASRSASSHAAKSRTGTHFIEGRPPYRPRLQRNPWCRSSGFK